MPLYEYQCRGCGSTFETLVRGNDRPRCPQCDGASLEKLLSVPAAHSGAKQGGLPISGPPRGGPCGMGGCGLPECEM
ncbi:MAG: zinc ribbon domain-containing protein [Pirellulales bacterium]